MDENLESAKMLLEMDKDGPCDAEVYDLFYGILYYNSCIYTYVLSIGLSGSDIRDPIPASPEILELVGSKGKVLREKAALIMK